jgi:hypothetical protein
MTRVSGHKPNGSGAQNERISVERRREPRFCSFFVSTPLYGIRVQLTFMGSVQHIYGPDSHITLAIYPTTSLLCLLYWGGNMGDAINVEWTLLKHSIAPIKSIRPINWSRSFFLIFKIVFLIHQFLIDFLCRLHRHIQCGGSQVRFLPLVFQSPRLRQTR